MDGVGAAQTSRIFMIKLCKSCNIELTSENWVQVKKWIRTVCRTCRSKQVIERDKKNPEKKRARMNAWKRKVGIVKQYPCKTCNEPCYKKYALAFCSDQSLPFLTVAQARSLEA